MNAEKPGKGKREEGLTHRGSGREEEKWEETTVLSSGGRKFEFQHPPRNYLLSNLNSENKLNLLSIPMKLQLIPLKVKKQIFPLNKIELNPVGKKVLSRTVHSSLFQGYLKSTLRVP